MLHWMLIKHPKIANTLQAWSQKIKSSPFSIAVISRIMTSRLAHIIMPRMCECFIKRGLRWLDSYFKINRLPWIIWWAQCNHCSCCSVAKSFQLFVNPQTEVHRLLCSPLSPWVCSKSYPLSPWCYLTISSSTASFFFCFQSFPASGSFPMSWIFASRSQTIGDSASVQSFRVDFPWD